MRTISDIIEHFILSTLGEDDTLSISRNQLAEHFDCAPSQINYVLSTRFTLDRGYLIESRRGGGGSITLMKLTDDSGQYLNCLINELPQELAQSRAFQIIEHLQSDGCLSGSEGDIFKSAIEDKALFVDKNIQDIARASIFKNVLTNLIKRGGREYDL